jgi:hypothetical protein
MSISDTTEDRSEPMGAVEALVRDDVERKKFLKMAGRRVGAGAAATGLAAFIAACGSSSSSSSTAGAPGGPSASNGSATAASAATVSSTASGDLAIVNYALTLEYLESQFYRKVIASGLFSGKVLSVLKDFGGDEDQHVVALKKAAMSMGTPAMEPMGKFPIKSAAQVTALAATVENLGASAYLGQAANIKSKEILAAALAIHTIEARHAATLNILLKKAPTNGAFATPMSMSQVLATVKPFIA